MSQQNPVPAFDVVNNVIRKLIEQDQIDDALTLMTEKYSPISTRLANMVTQNKANLRSLENDETISVISAGDAKVERARIRQAILTINARVPEELATKRLLTNNRSMYTSSDEESLEKIIGSVNNLVKINWLEKGIKMSKSVCQVVRADNNKGTGFILPGGYMMTNFHVLPTREKVKAAKIIFDYEEDMLGTLRTTSEFLLDETHAYFSPLQEFDYTIVKIKDNPAHPLSTWGSLEIEKFLEPQKGTPVSIIQHPLGQTKQIALTANNIINVDGKKLFYETDTERGSSGSPVFNMDWKVIALHHAGKTEDDGGLVVNSATNEKRGANEGILLKHILEDIAKKNQEQSDESKKIWLE